MKTRPKALANSKRYYRQKKARKVCVTCSKPCAKKRKGRGLSVYCEEHLEANRQKTASFFAAMPVEERRRRWCAAQAKFNREHPGYWKRPDIQKDR
jgi:hypothetical protein